VKFKTDTVDNEDNSLSYIPLSTANHHHNINDKSSNKKVNVI